MTAKNFPDVPSLPWKLHRSELARMLRDFREANRESCSSVESRFRDLEGRNAADPDWQSFRATIDREFGGSLTQLESPGPPHALVGLPTIKPLACAYGLHALMFHPLLAEQVRGNFLLHRETEGDDFARIDGEDVNHYGERITYWVPRKRLAGAGNIQMCHLEIDPDGHSVSHHHQGDELLYVDQGQVELRLESTGLRISLQEGEFAHYDGGQVHSAHNRSGRTARIFLIRFFQHRSGSRSRLMDQLVASRPSKQIVKRLIREMKVSAWTEDTRQKPYAPDEVLDTHGLGNFLQLLCSKHFTTEGRGPRTLDDLVDRSELKKCKYRYTRVKFARLHAGEARVRKEELLDLADIYSVSPMLLYDFLFPAFRYAVVVGADSMRKIGPEFGVQEGNVTYRVPGRHLAYSDMTIALVELHLDSGSPLNRHPGHELLRLLEGQVTVVFQGTSRATIKEGEYGFFDSSIQHQILNSGDRLAKMLVFRFLE